jgi:hypothetical protein
MEAYMRSRLVLSLAGFCALAGAVYSSAALADPYFYRGSSGNWTNVEYNDGACRYYYSHNAYDGTTNLNKYGDCSQVSIGPDGVAIPIIAIPPPRVAVGRPYAMPRPGY